MRFNFACYALCETTVDEDFDTDIPGYCADLLSFHLTESDALSEAEHVTELKRAAHKARYSDPHWPWATPEFKEPTYQIVPIQSMSFDCMDSAENMILQAAILQQKGVGA
jgi:hypothetical protein